MLATPHRVILSLCLALHPTAVPASRDLVSRTLLNWQLSRAIPFAGLVVSALVASSATGQGCWP